MANPELSHVDAQLVNAFLGLQLGGCLGFSIIVLTALGSRKVKRNSTWYTFCLSWILSCVSYTFVFLVGQQESPQFGVCVTQAAGIYSAPSLTSCGTLAFAIDMLIGVSAASASLPPRRKRFITLALLIIPFILWFILFIGFLLVGLNNPGLVQKGPNGTYCDLNSFTPAKISGLIVVASTFFILIIEGYIGSRLFKSRTLLKDRQLTTMAVRIIVFSLLGALGLGVGFSYVLFAEQGPVFDILLAILPACGVVIFGTHTDLLHVWIFWRLTPEVASEIEWELNSPSVYVPTPRWSAAPN